MKVTVEQSELEKMRSNAIALRQYFDDLSAVIAPGMMDPMYKHLNSIINTGDVLLSELDLLESETFDKKMDYFSSIAEAHDFDSTWSIFDVDNFDSLFSDQQAKTLVYASHWGSCGTIEVPIRSRCGHVTWLSMWIAANELIKKSGDDHHIFIESFKKNEELGIYELTTGS